MLANSSYPLDSGYSWIVAVVAGLLYSVAPGMTRGFGVVLVEMKAVYAIDDALGMWIILLSSSLILMTGPTCGLLLTRLELRTVTCIGLLLVAGGFILAAYAPTFHFLFVAFASLGIGMNYIFIPCLLSVSLYFNRYRAIALGIATSGAGFGTFYMPPLCRYLFDNLSYQECLLWLAAIVVQLLVPTMLMRPESYWQSRRRKKDFATENVIERPTLGSLHDMRAPVIHVTYSVSEHDINRPTNHMSNQCDDVIRSLIDLPSNHADERGLLFPESKLTASLRLISQSREMVSTADEDQHISVEATKTADSRDVEGRKVPTKLILRTLLTNTMYLVYLVSSFIAIQGFSIYYTMIPLYAEELGVPKWHVAYALAVYGGIEILSRVVHGLIANLRCISALCQLGISLIGAGLSILMLALWADIPAFYLCCFFNGAFFAPFISLVPLILLERLDPSLTPFGLSIVYGVQGISAVISFGINPYINKLTGSWVPSLLLSAATLGVAGAIKIVSSFIFPIKLRVCCLRRQRTMK